MKSFELYNPVRVIFGNGEYKKIGETAAQFGKKALVITYENHSFFTNLLDDVKNILNKNGVEPVMFCKIQSNPLLSSIREAISICKNEKIDMCIGIGGGSVMDSAKAIAAGVNYKFDAWKMYVSRHDVEIAIPPESTLPTIMLPTLPATSSEMNCIAVATNDETKEKAYIMTPVIFPKVSIVDPSLTCSLPPFFTAAGAVDAMSHVLEAYLNGDQNSPLQDRLHEGILVTIMDELRAVLKNPNDATHRANIQWAATLAWNGYIQSGLDATTPMHQMGHVLSALYNTTHGVTLAIFMNAYFRYTCTLNDERAARFALLGENVFGVYRNGKNDMQMAEETVDRILDFMKSVNVPYTLTAAEIPTTDADVEKIADEIVKHGCNSECYLPSIPPLGKNDILNILHLAI